MSFMKDLKKGAKKAAKGAKKGAKKAGKGVKKGVKKAAKSTVKTVKKGAKGSNIKDAQKALKKKLKVDVKIDGQFGPKMEGLIKQAQKKAKIKQTGVLDAPTQAWLGIIEWLDTIQDLAEEAADEFVVTKVLIKPLQAKFAELAKKREELRKQLIKLGKCIEKAVDDAQLATMLSIIVTIITVIVTIIVSIVTLGAGVGVIAGKAHKLAA